MIVEFSLHFACLFVKSGHLSRNRLAVENAPPGDTSSVDDFSGFCDEPPGDHGGPARRRALEPPILTYFDVL